MNKRNIIIVFSAIVFTLFALCSCSRGQVTRAGDSLRNTARRAENFMDNGLNAVENGVENGAGTVVGRGSYNANGSYSSNAANGNTMTGIGDDMAVAREGRATPLLPTLGDKSRDNMGQINTNNGSLDGGMGDIFDDTDMTRNSLRRDMLK